MKEKKAEFASSIVSNAYLFDEEMVNKARESWNLKHAIITIDGTEEVYNRTKAFIYKDTNAYKKVMDNIERLLKSHIAVTVNLNMDSANAEDLKELSHELGKRFSAYSSFKARCGLLKEYIGKIHRFDNDEQALNKRNEINAILNKYGIREKKYLSNLPKLNSCMADDPGAVTILADGRIGKCEHYGDSQEVGNIYCDKINEEKASSWKKTWPPIKECRTCVYYPWCFRLERCNGFVSECNQLQRLWYEEETRDRVINTYYKIKDKEEQKG